MHHFVFNACNDKKVESISRKNGEIKLNYKVQNMTKSGHLFHSQFAFIISATLDVLLPLYCAALRCFRSSSSPSPIKKESCKNVFFKYLPQSQTKIYSKTNMYSGNIIWLLKLTLYSIMLKSLLYFTFHGSHDYPFILFQIFCKAFIIIYV